MELSELYAEKNEWDGLQSHTNCPSTFKELLNVD